MDRMTRPWPPCPGAGGALGERVQSLCLCSLSAETQRKSCPLPGDSRGPRRRVAGGVRREHHWTVAEGAQVGGGRGGQAAPCLLHEFSTSWPRSPAPGPAVRGHFADHVPCQCVAVAHGSGSGVRRSSPGLWPEIREGTGLDRGAADGAGRGTSRSVGVGVHSEAGLGGRVGPRKEHSSGGRQRGLGW